MPELKWAELTYTASQAATILGVSGQLIRTACDLGALEHTRRGELRPTYWIPAREINRVRDRNGLALAMEEKRAELKAKRAAELAAAQQAADELAKARDEAKAVDRGQEFNHYLFSKSVAEEFAPNFNRLASEVVRSRDETARALKAARDEAAAVRQDVANLHEAMVHDFKSVVEQATAHNAVMLRDHETAAEQAESIERAIVAIGGMLADLPKQVAAVAESNRNLEAEIRSLAERIGRIETTCAAIDRTSKNVEQGMIRSASAQKALALAPTLNANRPVQS